MSPKWFVFSQDEWSLAEQVPVNITNVAVTLQLRQLRTGGVPVTLKWLLNWFVWTMWLRIKTQVGFFFLPPPSLFPLSPFKSAKNFIIVLNNNLFIFFIFVSARANAAQQ